MVSNGTVVAWAVMARPMQMQALYQLGPYTIWVPRSRGEGIVSEGGISMEYD